MWASRDEWGRASRVHRCQLHVTVATVCVDVENMFSGISVFFQFWNRFKRQTTNVIVFFIPWEMRIKLTESIISIIPRPAFQFSNSSIDLFSPLSRSFRVGGCQLLHLPPLAFLDQHPPRCCDLAIYSNTGSECIWRTALFTFGEICLWRHRFLLVTILRRTWGGRFLRRKRKKHSTLTQFGTSRRNKLQFYILKQGWNEICELL